MGDGPFIEEKIYDKLLLRLDQSKPDKHGFVEPAVEMPVADYQKALAETQGQWTRDEE